VHIPIGVAQVFENEDGIERVVVEGLQRRDEGASEMCVDLVFAAEPRSGVLCLRSLDEHAAAVVELHRESFVTAVDRTGRLPRRRPRLPGHGP
jgi:hypothetical protein